MGGIKIVDGSLILSITDERQVSALAKLDTNHDGKVLVDDFPCEREVGEGLGACNEAGRGTVTQALTDGGAFKSELQQQSFRQFLDIYPKIQHFNEVTDEWNRIHVNTTVRELEFEKGDWDSKVLPQIKISGNGALAPSNISKLSADLYTIMYGLANSKVPESSNHLPTTFMTCDTTYISSLVYSTANVPSFVREQLVSAIQIYSNSAAWLSQYEQVECDGEDWFDGCGVFEQASFEDAMFIPPLRTCASEEEADDSNLYCTSMSIFEGDTPASALTSSTEDCDEGGSFAPMP